MAQEGERTGTITLRYVVDANAALGELGKIKGAMDQIAKQANAGANFNLTGSGPGGSGGSPNFTSLAGSVTRLDNELGRLAGSLGRAVNAINVAIGKFAGGGPSGSSNSILSKLDETNMILRSISSAQSGLGGTKTPGPMAGYYSTLSNVERLAKQRAREEAAVKASALGKHFFQLGANGIDVEDQISSRMSYKEQREARAAHKAGQGPSEGMGLRPLQAAYIGRQIYHYIVAGGEMTANAINTANRSDLTAGQRDVGVSGQIPLIGPIVKAGIDLADAIDGTAERVRRANQEFSLGTARNTAEAQLRSAVSSEKLESGFAGNQVAAMAGLSPVTLPNIDRTSYAGEYNYQRAARLQNPQQQLNIARARTIAARNDVNVVDSEISRLGRGIGLEQQRANFHQGNLQNQINIGNATGGNRLSRAANAGRDVIAGEGSNAMLSNQRLISMYQEMEQLQQRRRQAGIAATQAEVTENQRLADVMRTNLDLLRERLQMMQQGARRIGLQTPVERAFGLHAVERIVSAGPENVNRLPAWLIQQGMATADRVVGRIVDRAAQNTPEFNRLNELGQFGTGPERNTDQLEASITRLANALAGSEIRDLQTTANGRMETLNATMQQLIRAIQRRGELGVQNVGNQQVVGNAQQAVPN